ncbi:MAG: endo-1,4-beta-xylanase [Sphingomonas sp.]|uniref:endo-1,4-beta-xylanase n=1 Tax=Sphingomonas sp. TaxID=28214 RepID=UPI001AD4EDCB|nr:endo-1,4-beta-xylanase [Sphingomonas sp.]MBN8807838.1 endo-1,4-beta-xylanase [Sphingomonas sp.]
MTSAFTRRETLLLGASAALVGNAPALAASEDSLHAIARSRGLRFGSALAWGPPGADRASFANPRYAALLERDCGLLVAENEMKWPSLHYAPATFDFTRADAIVRYAERHGMAMRGHNLLWHQPKWLPKWVNDYDFGHRPRDAAAELLTRHIETVCRHFGTRVTAWDVVNEAVRPSDGQLYDTVLSRAYGGTEPLLDLAFHTARAAAPGAQLVYNDYMGWEPGNAEHRAGVLRLLEGFRRRGTPVDALGLQSHLITQGRDASLQGMEADWRHFLDAVTAMGFGLVVTELDVRDDNLPADPAARDRAVADCTKAYLDLTLDYRQVRDVLVWGMCDRYSWIEGFKPRPDGARRRPCPYDDAFRPKPMRQAIAAALAAAPTR